MRKNARLKGTIAQIVTIQIPSERRGRPQGIAVRRSLPVLCPSISGRHKAQPLRYLNSYLRSSFATLHATILTFTHGTQLFIGINPCLVSILPYRGETISAYGLNIHKSGLFKDRKSTRLNSSHVRISYAVFCL